MVQQINEARVCQPTSGHMFICPQIEVNDHPASLGVTCQRFQSLVVVDFLDRDYRYKLITNQISHDAGLTPIPYISRKILPQRGSNQRRIL